MKLCVYTCITGDYDNLHEINLPEKDVDYLCFTNNKSLKSNTWKIVHIKDDKLDNHRLSRKIKMLGHPIISKNYDVSVWMDASVVWQKPISEFVQTYLKNSPFAAFKHHQRSSVKEEAIACLRSHKDSKNNIIKTLAFLESEKFPDTSGLFEMTSFIKKHNDKKVQETMQLWFDINQKYSKRDQLSFTYAAWKTGLHVNTINLNVWHNHWFYTIAHNNNSRVSQCHIYYGDSSDDFSFDKYYIYDYQQKTDHYKIDCVVPCDTKTIEVSPVDAINTLITDLQITPTPGNTIPPSIIHYTEGFVLYSENDIFRFTGNFQKGQKLTLSLTARQLNPSELYQIIQSQYLKIDKLTAEKNNLSNINQEQSRTIANLNKIYQNTINSKSWKVFYKIRRLFPPYKR